MSEKKKNPTLAPGLTGFDLEAKDLSRLINGREKIVTTGKTFPAPGMSVGAKTAFKRGQSGNGKVVAPSSIYEGEIAKMMHVGCYQFPDSERVGVDKKVAPIEQGREESPLAHNERVKKRVESGRESVLVIPQKKQIKIFKGSMKRNQGVQGKRRWSQLAEGVHTRMAQHQIRARKGGRVK